MCEKLAPFSTIIVCLTAPAIIYISIFLSQKNQYWYQKFNSDKGKAIITIVALISSVTIHFLFNLCLQ